MDVTEPDDFFLLLFTNLTNTFSFYLCNLFEFGLAIQPLPDIIKPFIIWGSLSVLSALADTLLTNNTQSIHLLALLPV